ncbi:hypothetical protein K1719_004108 [Acacia pycnantha]|nr:hypothetical protein K1719_004108 [Acacia pycnantha]
MTFFLVSTHYDFPFVNSCGGFLRLFTPQTAFNPAGRNKIVFVEFDSFSNQWDPNPESQSPHIGINLGSIRSKDTQSWPSDFCRRGFWLASPPATGELVEAHQVLSWDFSSTT